MFGIDFMSLIMQAPTTGNASMDSVLAIISGIAIIAGIAAPYLKQRAETTKIGQFLDTFSQKAVETQEEQYKALSAIRSVVPEVDGALKKYEVPLSKIESRVQTAADQLEFFRQKTPNRIQAKNVVELPRENFTVEIKSSKDKTPV